MRGEEEKECDPSVIPYFTHCNRNPTHRNPTGIPPESTGIPILIEEGTETAAFGVVVPDLPGCFSAGDTLDEAMEAAAAWIDAALDAGAAIPAPSRLADVRGLRDYEGWSVGVIELDLALFDNTIERVNITLPKRVLRRLEDLAAARHQSRGAFIAELTMHTK